MPLHTEVVRLKGARLSTVLQGVENISVSNVFHGCEEVLFMIKSPASQV